MNEDRVHISDESNDRKYFTMTPRLVWALSRSPFDYTVWNVIKMIAGDSGECRIGTRILAEAAMMSVSKAHECQMYLMEVGTLEGELKFDEKLGTDIWHFRIPDLWEANVRWALDFPKLREMLEFKKHLNERGCSCGERGCSLHEHKKIYIRRSIDHNDDPAEPEPSQEEEKANGYGEAIKLWERENCNFPSPIIASQINELVLKYSFEWFEHALTKALIYDKGQSIPYIEKILKSIRQLGGLEEWQAENQRRQEMKDAKDAKNKRRNGRNSPKNSRRNGRREGRYVESEKERRTREAMEAIGSTYHPPRR